MSPKINNLLLTIFPVLLVACGSGQTNNGGNNYYSASNTTYYQIESQTTNGASQLTFSAVSPGYSIKQAPLTFVAPNNYTYSQNGATGTVTLDNGNLGISYQSTSGAWVDFATQNTSNIALPTGSYNLICDQTNLSPCQATIANNQITITEFSQTGQATTLCQNSNITQAATSANPYLYQFSCGVNGGSITGTWYAVPLTIESTTALMLSEFSPAQNNNDDETDEIAFPISPSINPSGAYYYLYQGVMLGGVGLSSAQFTVAGLVNPIVGTCSGAACALIQNQYYNNNPATGFAWYNVNQQSNYNLVGNDTMGIYQDSYEGFYF